MGKWTRRGLITAGVVAGGGLAVGVFLRPGHRAPELAKLVSSPGEHLVNVWVKIAPDNQITAIVPHSEMGQGAQTVLAQMLADEMGARWQDVSFVEAPAEDEYANWAMGKGFILGDANIPKALVPTVDGLFLQVTKAMHLQITGGSASIRTTGVYGMRVAGAAARENLIAAAADAWGVPAGEIVAQNSELTHAASKQRAEFATFAEAAGAIAPSRTPQLKQPAEFTLMGRSLPRHDIPAKVDGTAQFSMDAQVPGMKYAAIQAAPVFGAQVASVDSAAAEKVSGVHKVVQLDNAVAVVADGYWSASQALRQVKVEWTETAQDSINSEQLFAQFDRDMSQARANGQSDSDLQQGDIDSAMSDAAQVIEATYRVPFLAHACMEPMNATARIDGGRCEVWVGSQNPLGFRHDVAAALELDVQQVTVHQHTMGGGFGRRANSDVVVQAALIAREAEVPVKLIWSREEDVRHDHYRPAVASHFKAALTADGDVIGWDNIYHEKHEPVEAPTIPYAVSHQHIHYTDSPTHVPFGPWRSVDHSQHGFFTEAFFDEVAEAADKDPYQLRRQLLAGKPRHLKVLDTAAENAGWGQPVPAGHGRGISLQESFGSLVAQVVDVSVSDGQIKVDRVVCAVDAGFAVSPDGFVAQMESGSIYGLSAALYGDVQIEQGAVKQGNFHDYPVVRMAEAPVIETHIINSDAPWGGAGEPGTPGIAPALANAVYQATGTRVRQLPLSNYDFSYKIVEPEEVI
ncbi:MAG: molybdopterin cofactor-binding domain-containing protein [Pseudomonadota bacterium]